ncbi:MAG: hypothetical protein GY714_16690 [Desulfobacterales bacterium]|nr:hypothetical protein [Desulfobacterales bacterium]
MSNYTRAKAEGGTFFFTVVSYRRQKNICDKAPYGAFYAPSQRLKE